MNFPINGLLAFKTAYIVDIACVAILLIGGLSGAKKGFVKCVFGLISTLAALILAFSFASLVCDWLNSAFGMTDFFAGKIESGLGEKFNAVIGDGGVEAALENVSLPGFVKDLIVKNADAESVQIGTTLASVVAPVLAQFAGLLIAGLSVFIVAKIALFFVERLLTKIVRAWSVAAALNGLLGLAAGALKGAILICGVLALLSVVPGEGITEFFDQTLFVRYIYNENPLTALLGTLIDF